MSPEVLELLGQIGKYAYMLSPVGMLSWWLYDRHMKKKELAAKEIENQGSTSDVIAQNLDLYQKLFQDLEARILKAHEIIAALEKELAELKEEYNILKAKQDEGSNN